MSRRIPLRTAYVGLSLVAVILLVLSVFVVRTSTDALAAERTARRTLLLSRDALQLQVDEETGIRGYTSTGESLFLRPFDQAVLRYPQTIRALSNGVRILNEDPALAFGLVRINRAWLERIAYPLMARPHDVALQREGKREIDAERRQVAQLDERLDKAAAAVDDRAITALRIELGLSALSILSLGVVALVAARAAATRRRAALEALRLLAERDPLTELPNRRVFIECLTREIVEARTAELAFVVAFVDLDDFKLVNDRHGHDAGDLVLRETARRLELGVRAGDVVARLGGDEFVVLLRGRTASGAVAVIERIRNKVTAPIEVANGALVSVGASIGVAEHPRDGHDAVALLAYADREMYRCKGRKPERSLDRAGR